MARGVEPLLFWRDLPRYFIGQAHGIHGEVLQPVLEPPDVHPLLFAEGFAGGIDIGPPLGVDVNELIDVPEAEAEDVVLGTGPDLLGAYKLGGVLLSDDFSPDFLPVRRAELLVDEEWG